MLPHMHVILLVWKQIFPLTPLHKQSTFKRKVARRENDIMGYHLRCPSSWEVIWDILFSGLYFLMDNNHGPLKVWNFFLNVSSILNGVKFQFLK
jgi:hypothetical protein